MRSIEEYLHYLRRELAGTDPAVRQDALYDADEYLRSELAGVPADELAEELAATIERYGTPEEIARAYRAAAAAPRTPTARLPGAESREAAAAVLARSGKRERVGETGTVAEDKPWYALPEHTTLGPFFGVLVDPHAYGSLFYMFLAIITGILYFTWAITGLSLSVGLIILIIGIPFILIFLASTRAISLVEGWMVEALLGVRMPRRPRLPAETRRLTGRIKYWLSDRRTWTTLLYILLMLPLGVIYFTLAMVCVTIALALAAAPIVQIFVADPVFWFDGWSLYVDIWLFPFLLAVGALLIIVTLHLARWLGRLHGRFAKALLVGKL